MTETLYRGDGKKRRDALQDFPEHQHQQLLDPAGYRAEPELAKAVHVSLMLGRPLLLTGEPGSGKSQLAYSIAHELDLACYKFETKSTSIGRDLFYTFDTLGFFRAGKEPQPDHALQFTTFNAFGKAILAAHEQEDLRGWVASEKDASGQPLDGAPRRSVVLIDEVDKAPRDFPNDILNELENLYFRIPELAVLLKSKGYETIEASSKMAPFLVVTSNSEADLPDAFLRRCVYYHLPFPKRKTLLKIIKQRVPHYFPGKGGGGDVEDKLVATPLLESALDFFDVLRNERRVEKKAATSELLNWLLVLTQYGFAPQQSLRSATGVDVASLKMSLTTLTKTRNDQDLAFRKWKEWREN